MWQHSRGSGLKTVRVVVEAHGGDCFAMSGGEGRGSIFVIELPRSE